MRGSRAAIAILLALFLCFPAAALRAQAPRPPRASLRLALVQLRVDDGRLPDLEGLVASAASAGADLVVFPEYTGVFLSLAPWIRRLDGARTVEEATASVARESPDISSARGLVARAAAGANQLMQQTFGGLARRHRVAILAGTAFVPDGAGGGGLRNRAFVFGPDGSLLYTQDKVFLTEDETDLLGVRPGRLADARPFLLGTWRCALTICRDSFHEDWEPVFRGVDLWMDVKANGVPFAQQERASFLLALPARLPGAKARWGATDCLVGGFLQFAWEGRSSLAELLDGKGVERTACPDAVSQGVIVFSITRGDL